MKNLLKRPEKRHCSLYKNKNTHNITFLSLLNTCCHCITLSTLSPRLHQLRYGLRKFGTPVCFSDCSAADAQESYLECVTRQDSTFSIEQMRRDCRIQAVLWLQSSSTQAQWYHNTSVHQKKWIFFSRVWHSEGLSV